MHLQLIVQEVRLCAKNVAAQLYKVDLRECFSQRLLRNNPSWCSSNVYVQQLWQHQFTRCWICDMYVSATHGYVEMLPSLCFFRFSFQFYLVTVCMFVYVWCLGSKTTWSRLGEDYVLAWNTSFACHKHNWRCTEDSLKTPGVRCLQCRYRCPNFHSENIQFLLAQRWLEIVPVLSRNTQWFHS